MDGVTIVFAAVVGARFVLPLFIPAFPLPAIIGCLVLDAADQSIFQAFGYDPPGYQSYDKAMDVFYLAVAYLATMRNWQALPAYRVGQFLYFYRLVGVVAFELTHTRALLLVFPNTFEYFFIAYEGIRTRWAPVVLQAALVGRCWPDSSGCSSSSRRSGGSTSRSSTSPTSWPSTRGQPRCCWSCSRSRRWCFWFVIRPRLRTPDHDWQFDADPLPEPMDTAKEMSAWRAEHGRLRSYATVEKVVLLGLLSVIFAQTLPGVRASTFDLFVGIAAVVVANSAITLAVARRGTSIESTALQFGLRILLNFGIVFLGDWLLRLDGGDLDRADTFFYLMLISLVTTLHDRYTPVLEYRQDARAAPAPRWRARPGRDADHRASTGLVVRRLVVETCPKSPSGHSSKYGHLHLLQGGDRSPL